MDQATPFVAQTTPAPPPLSGGGAAGAAVARREYAAVMVRRQPTAARRHRLRAALVTAALALAALAAWWRMPPDPGRALRAHAPPLARVLRAPAPALGERVEWWRLVSTVGDTAVALWRSAPPGTRSPWTVVLMGGLQTGDRAALLLPDGPFNVLAVDWPWRGPRRMGAGRIALELGAIREAVLRSPGVLARGVEATARESGADTSRIAVLGASLGVPPALAAVRLTRRVDALVLVDGAADLDDLLRAGLERVPVAPWLAAPLAALAARLIRPLEPLLNAPAAAGLPVLLMNSEQDELMPAADVRRLHAGLPWAEVRWRPGRHLRPHRGATIDELTREALAWLQGLPRRAP